MAMDLVVALEHRFDRTPDGRVWTQTECAYPSWAYYLEVFDRVRPLARVRDVRAVPADWRHADGAGVSFAPVPYFIGPLQYLQRAHRVRRAARGAVGPADAVILRVSSTVADSVNPLLRQTGHPYGVEVVGDPYDVFAPGAVRHPLRPFFRWWFTRQLRRQCTRASAAAYVTAQALQRRYPCPNYEVGISDVEISEGALVPTPRPARPDARSFTLIIVGTLEQLYKAPDVLIDAVGACARAGLDLRLVLVGDGKHRSELEARARAVGIGERVRFLGFLAAGGAVRAELDRADLFVLPSHQEGLPRAMVEAMARALPCIGSTVGGIPELLPPDDLVPPGDVAALAAKIRAVLTDPARLAAMSARNLAKAREYHEEILCARRIAFYRLVRERTATWLATQRC